jgi:hypothetical protein
MSFSLARNAAWPAKPLPLLSSAFSPDSVDGDIGVWQPLRQTWLGEKTTDGGFQPGGARVGWHALGLSYEVVLFGAGQRNDARELNELTWERGDVCEIFLHDTATDYYIELHVTPENQRLQLRFPFGAIDAVRRGDAPIEDFMISDPRWVDTVVERSADFFRVHVIIPARAFAERGVLDSASRLRTAVCRYDYRATPPVAILSSTASLDAPWFHCPEAWTPLDLQPSHAHDSEARNRVHFI